MEEIKLKVNNREIQGKKVRFLRRNGITPVNLFGHGIESLSLQCDTVNLSQVLAAAGHTRLIELKIDSEKKPRNVIVRNVQLEPRNHALLHVDFYQVKMEEQVRMEVPVVLIGEAPALKLKENMLTHELNSLTVECLPADIPSSFEMDISSLTEAEQALRVKDIQVDSKVTIINDPEQILAKISWQPAVKAGEVEVEEEIAEEVAAEAKEEAPGEAEESKSEHAG